jgi:DNA polymerase-3 subunit gamma/tau
MVKPAPAVEPKPSPPQLNNEIERLKQSWRQVIEQAPEEVKRTPAIAILRSAGVKPVTIEGDTVVLTFRYPIHKEKMEAAENKQVAEKSNFLGHPCHVRCSYEPEDNHLLKAALKMGAQVTSVEEK